MSVAFLRTPANAVGTVFVLGDAFKVDMVSVDSAKPVGFGAVLLLEFDDGVHHLLNGEEAIVVHERRVSLVDLLAIVIEPYTG